MNPRVLIMTFVCNIIIVVVVCNLYGLVQVSSSEPTTTTTPAAAAADHITVVVVGAVYCDVCCNNTSSAPSYFLPGVEVHIECKLKANSARSREEISVSVNTSTDKYGLYKWEIPSSLQDHHDGLLVDGYGCMTGPPVIQSFCRASLIGTSSSSACNSPALTTTSNWIKALKPNTPNYYNRCMYSLSGLSYRPSFTNSTLCGTGTETGTGGDINYKQHHHHHDRHTSSDHDNVVHIINSSKFFLPYFPPPYGFYWPPLPPLPPLPQLPPFPWIPNFPPLPLPPSVTYNSPPPPPPPPSLAFPFPPLPPFRYPPWVLPPPPPPPPHDHDHQPPPFNLADPRTWFPNIPNFMPPPTPTPVPPTP